MTSPKTKLAVAAIVLVAAAAAVLFWQGTGASVALADVLANMDRIEAYTFESTVTFAGPKNRQDTATTWISRDSGRKTVIRDANSGEVLTEAYVLPAQKTAVVIEHDKKTYMRLSFDDQWADMLRKEVPDHREMLVQIQKCRYTSLGASTLDGVAVEGFRTTDPNYVKDGAKRVDASLWVDVRTGLPVQSEEEIEATDGVTFHRVSRNFQWDVSIDPALFQASIPEGYTNAAGGPVQMPSMNEEAAIKSLRLCVELRGRYPLALSEAGLEGFANRLPMFKGLTKEQVKAYVQDPAHRGEVIQKIMPLMSLWAFYGILAEQKREPAYYGDAVTPETPHAVLLRWKLDDGRYRVVFGDLSATDVSAEELAVLEAIPPNEGPGAIRPQPADGFIGCPLTRLRLQWTPGVAAVQHRVYFGQSPQSLALVATVTEPNCSQLPALQRDTPYHWRVDEVKADGTVTPGQVWQFNTGRLAAHWRFDDASGQRVADATGHGYDGQIHGNPTWTTGVTGGALQFDGDGDYVDVGTGTEFNITGPITVVAWFRIAGFDKESQTIISKGDTAWRLQKNRRTPSLTFAGFGLKTDDAWGATRGSVKVDDDQWHQAVGVYDGARIALYIDGKLDASAPATGSIATNDEPVQIGDNSEEVDRAWHGLIDEVHIYTYALSEAEISALYKETSPADTVK